MSGQLDAAGRLRHLLSLADLDRALLESLLERAQSYLRPPGALPYRSRLLQGMTIANLFFEPSTRTRASFELAASRLGADVLNLDVKVSSRAKGESVLDTMYTLQAMSVDVLVLRDSEPGVPAMIAAQVAPHVSVLNAGEAYLSHPTQGLLDALTIRQHKGRFESISVAIVGDISHSRVARSAVEALATLGAGEIRLVAPPALQPQDTEFRGCSRFEQIEAGLADADVIMTLRVQRERMAGTDAPDAADYHRGWGITAERLRLARPDCIVMHPGPMNRGVEIDADVADGPNSVIRQQVTNGVAVRMAVLSAVAESLAGRRPA